MQHTKYSGKSVFLFMIFVFLLLGHQHYPSVGLSSYSGTGTAGTGETGLTITKCGTIAAASKHHHLHGK